MAVDYGERRVGLAVSDPTRTIASPAGFIARRAGKRPPIAELVRRAHARGVSGFVLGLPLDRDGEETPRSLEVRRVAEELGRRTGMPVALVDERYSTAAALRAIREMGGTTRGRKGDVDALAATILLQHVLDAEKRALAPGRSEVGDVGGSGGVKGRDAREPARTPQGETEREIEGETEPEIERESSGDVPADRQSNGTE